MLWAQEVRSLLWPTEACPVYMTGGEDGMIWAWSEVADAPDVAPKRSAAAVQNGGAPRQTKRRKQERGL